MKNKFKLQSALLIIGIILISCFPAFSHTEESKQLLGIRPHIDCRKWWDANGYGRCHKYWKRYCYNWQRNISLVECKAQSYNWKRLRVLYNQAAIFTKEEKNQLAVEVYKKILKLDPTNYSCAVRIYQLV